MVELIIKGIVNGHLWGILQATVDCITQASEYSIREFRSSVPRVVFGPAELASPRILLQRQSLRPCSHPAESESTF